MVDQFFSDTDFRVEVEVKRIGVEMTSNQHAPEQFMKESQFVRRMN